MYKMSFINKALCNFSGNKANEISGAEIINVDVTLEPKLAITVNDKTFDSYDDALVYIEQLIGDTAQ